MFQDTRKKECIKNDFGEKVKRKKMRRRTVSGNLIRTKIFQADLEKKPSSCRYREEEKNSVKKIALFF